MKTPRRNFGRGFTLVETAVAITVAAGVMALAIHLFPRLMSDTAVASEIAETRDIMTSVRSVHAARANFTGLNNIGMAKSGAVPSNRVADESMGRIENRWGGDVNFAPSTFQAVDDSALITHKGVPQNACLGLVPGLAEAARRIFAGVDGNMILVKDQSGTNPSLIGSACSAGGQSGNVIISYEISK